MSNALAIYGKVDNPQGFALEMGKTFAAMTGVPLDQGPAVALTCLIEGLTPVDYRRRYHTVDGKPTMRADAMLAEFRMNHGGDYRIVERSGERAAIEFSRNGEVYPCEFTWRQAQESRWPWKDWKAPADKRQLKDNWGTPTDQQAMLWARCVSDGLRAFCPELVAGVYTPEEMQDVLDAESRIVSVTPVEPRKTASQMLAEQAEAAVVGESQILVEPEDVTFEPHASPEAARDAAGVEAPEAYGTITNVQRKELDELYGFLAVPLDSQAAALTKRGVNAVRSLSREQADDILGKLRPLARAKRKTEGDSGN